jgi:hypothetical protein
MSLTLDAKTYVNDVPRTSDIMRYHGPGHTLSSNDYVDLSRTAAKPTADYAGKGRSRIKLTRAATDGTDPVGDIIIDIAVSIPVGAQSSEQDSAINDAFAYASSAAALALFKTHDIVQ